MFTQYNFGGSLFEVSILSLSGFGRSTVSGEVGVCTVQFRGKISGIFALLFLSAHPLSALNDLFCLLLSAHPER